MNNQLINRKLLDSINKAFQYFSVLTLTGPRQSGKTTLCRKLFADLPYYNFEDIATLSAFQQDPKSFLTKHEEGMIIDEAQRFPDIFSYLQVIVDEQNFTGEKKRKYIVTGSSNFALMQKATQSMAGRTAAMTLLPLSSQEIDTVYPNAKTDTRILRGGYPAVWKTDDEGRNFLLSNYYTTYVERDLRSMINIKDLTQFNTFIRLCAGRIGSECNASALSVEVGVSVPTIQSWLSILEASYIIYRLHPYHTNIGKRLTKTPKLYFYDTGLAAWLMGIRSEEQLSIHPLRGNLFENMIINDFQKYYFNRAERADLFFYRDKGQHEVDLLRMNAEGKTHAYEIKSSMTYRNDFFDGLHYLQNLIKENLVSSALIYDGGQELMQKYDSYCHYRNLPKLIEDEKLTAND